MKKIDLDKLRTKYLEKFPNSNLKIIDLAEKYLVLIENKYGYCLIRKSNLLKGDLPIIKSAINPTEYWINQAKEIHGDKYDYSKVIYKNTRTKIIINCEQHGEFEQRPFCHIKGEGCPKCGFKKIKILHTLTTEEFIKRAIKVHKNKYDYSKTKYINTSTKVHIVCKEHGEFWQTPIKHLRNHSCNKCANKKRSIAKQKEDNLWRYSNWEKTGIKSKEFDSFKVYIIECWNEEERFYKIGKTFTTVEYRFKKNYMPYNYKIIKTFINTAKNVSNMENELKIKNKEYKYLPKLKFGGKYECFSLINYSQL